MTNYELLHLLLALQDIDELISLINKYRIAQEDSKYC